MSRDGSRVIIGAPYDKSNQGSVYIFEWSQNNDSFGEWGWVQKSKLERDVVDALSGVHYGEAVALDGDVALVGHRRWNNGRGKVSIYHRNNVSNSWLPASTIMWTHFADVMAGDLEFGYSLDILGSTAIIGAFEAAYIFRVTVDTNSNELIQKLVASDRVVESPGWFGNAVSISEQVAIVGSFYAGTQKAGAAYFFREIDGVWTEEKKMTPDDARIYNYFGRSVSVRRDLAIISAHSHDFNGMTDSGAAYLFRRGNVVDANGKYNWDQVQKLTADDGAPGDQFGFSVGLFGSRAIVGASLRDDSSRSDVGAAYIFNRNDTSSGSGSNLWFQENKMIPTSEKSFIIGAGGTGSVYIGGELEGEVSLPVSKYSNILVAFGHNNATLIASKSSSFLFQFTNSIPGSTIHAAIITNSFCTVTNSNFQIKEGTTTGAIVGRIVTGSSNATLTRDIENEIDVSDKNSGTVTLNYCLRADLYDDSNPNFSVGARKVDLTLEVTYDNEENFNVTSIQTSEFVASDVDSSATRSVGINIYKDSCSYGCEIVIGEISCFTSEENRAEIGDTITLCLKADATDVELRGIESAKVDAGEAFSSDIVSFEADGTPGRDNFVTTTSVANGEVTLKTLLIPAYYDALNGGAYVSLELSGTALLNYIQSNGRQRDLLGPRDAYHHRLQNENQVRDGEISPFSVKIPVDKLDTIPKMAHDGSESNSAGMNIFSNSFSFSSSAATIIAIGVITFLC
mmetsp:Transcript_2424/g.5246  ORF Transcript_2424/g.5246 Transcript_2424/m.5246 type:complete len:738 (-) Transcript_2424:272-2485(-)